MKTINYTKAKKLSHSSNYIIYLNDSIEINLDSIYLDKKNIREISLNKDLRQININQINKKTKYFQLSAIDLSKIQARRYFEWNDEIKMIILNGIFIDSIHRKNIIIEYDAIKELTLLNCKNVEDKDLRCLFPDGDNLIIITK